MLTIESSTSELVIEDELDIDKELAVRIKNEEYVETIIYLNHADINQVINHLCSVLRAAKKSITLLNDL